MPDALLAKWLKHYDPLYRGWTPDGIANGVCLTNGFSFPRIKGGYNLRRSTSRQSDPQDRIVGAAGHDATTIRVFSFATHEPSTTYYYRLCAVGGGGMENNTDEVLAEVVFDAAGNWIGASPNPPTDLRVASLSGGRFLLKWMYPSQGEQAEPTEFRVYHNGGAGQIDYQTPTATIPYRRGQVHFEHTSAAFPHGTRVRWAVRAATSTGIEELNEQQTSGWAEANPPPANPAVLIAVEDA
jgi:hypothetical protein